MKKADAKKKTDFWHTGPFEHTFSSECDFKFKVRVEISVIKAKWINVIDRLNLHCRLFTGVRLYSVHQGVSLFEQFVFVTC